MWITDGQNVDIGAITSMVFGYFLCPTFGGHSGIPLRLALVYSENNTIFNIIYQQIASQIADVHKRMEEEEEQMRKNHRHQMKELGQRHGREMEKQLAHYHDDLKNREDESRKICQEYEQK